MSQRRSAHSRRQASVDYPRYPPQGAEPQGQLQQQYSHLRQPSDYESDNQAHLSDFQPSCPPPPPRTTDELNLSVLKRHNSAIASILSVAPYAVIYKFSPLPEPLWSKTGMEGSLFICQLIPGAYGEDRYAAIVLNRRGLDNFECELRQGENTGVEITDDFVIVSLKEGYEQEIYGVFVFSEGPGTSTEQTRMLTGELMKQLAEAAGLSRTAAEAQAAEATANHINGRTREVEEAPDNEQPGQPMGRQISLQELFGQQRAEDASWSVRMHSPQEREPSRESSMPQPLMTQQSFSSRRQAQMGPQPVAQPDVIGDLFRNAGLAPRI